MTGYSKRKRPFDSSRQDNCTLSLAGPPASAIDVSFGDGSRASLRLMITSSSVWIFAPWAVLMVITGAVRSDVIWNIVCLVCGPCISSAAATRLNCPSGRVLRSHLVGVIIPVVGSQSALGRACYLCYLQSKPFSAGGGRSNFPALAGQ